MLEFKEVPAALPSMVRAMIPIGSTLTRSEPNRAERGRGITDDSWRTWRRLGSSSSPPAHTAAAGRRPMRARMAANAFSYSGFIAGPREGPRGGKVPSRWKWQGYEPSSFPRFRIDASTAPSNCFFAFSLSTSLPRYEYGSSYSRVHVTWDPAFVGTSSRRVVPDFRKPWVCRKAYTAFSRRSVTSVSDSTFIPPRLYTQGARGPEVDSDFTKSHHRGQRAGSETSANTFSGRAGTSKVLSIFVMRKVHRRGDGRPGPYSHTTK